MTQRYDTYKDSGVQWLGEIPGHWNCVRIKALFLNIREKNNPIQTEERLSLSIDKGVTLYSEKTTNLDRFKEDCSQYLLAQEDDIVLNSMNMIVGAVGKSKYFGCVSPAYYVIRLRDTSNYIDYYSQLLNIQKIRDVYRIMGKGIMAIDRGDGKVNTCRLKVPYDSFGSIKIPLPPLSEQHSIVSYLDDKCGKIDKMLEGKQKQIELLAEMKQRIIADAVTRGINPDVKMKATNSICLGDVPMHWHVMRYGTLFKLKPVKPHHGEELLSVFLNFGVIRAAESDKRTHAASEDLSKYQLVEPTDFVMNNQQAWRGSVGVSKLTGIISPAYHIFKMPNRFDPEYANYLLRSEAIVGQFEISSRGVGSIQRTLNFSWLNNSTIPIPPISEQRAIVSYITDKTSKIDTLTSKLQQEIESIKEYKQRLISDVVTGQIKVC